MMLFFSALVLLLAFIVWLLAISACISHACDGDRLAGIIGVLLFAIPVAALIVIIGSSVDAAHSAEKPAFTSEGR